MKSSRRFWRKVPPIPENCRKQAGSIFSMGGSWYQSEDEAATGPGAEPRESSSNGAGSAG